MAALVSKALQQRLRDFAALMRLDRPIGTFLLLWPTLWALWIASQGRPALHLLVIFVAGTIVMRSAGCVINDFADRNIDPHVKRTRTRPLAARRLAPQEALVLFAGLVLLAFWLVTRLDSRTVLFSFIGAALTITYPLMKRFVPLPQFYLGAAFGWAVPMAFVAVTGTVPRVGWVLFIVTLLWAGVYDTLYAMVDRDDDLKLGVNSTAIAFGDLDRELIAVMQAMVLGGLLMVGHATGLRAPFYIGIAIGAALFVWQQWMIRSRNRDQCFKAFLNNNYFGLAVFIGTVLAL
jgi:4-hydroxybenzoate polyprenyltransferase